jgi:hypothetical protein
MVSRSKRASRFSPKRNIADQHSRDPRLLPVMRRARPDFRPRHRIGPGPALDWGRRRTLCLLMASAESRGLRMGKIVEVEVDMMYQPRKIHRLLLPACSRLIHLRNAAPRPRPARVVHALAADSFMGMELRSYQFCKLSSPQLKGRDAKNKRPCVLRAVVSDIIMRYELKTVLRLEVDMSPASTVAVGSVRISLLHQFSRVLGCAKAVPSRGILESRQQFVACWPIAWWSRSCRACKKGQGR